MDFDISKVASEEALVSLVAAVVILAVGFIAASWLARLTRQLSERGGKLSPTVVPLIAGLVRWGLRVVVLLAALDQVGVETAGFLAMLGATGLAVGLALKDTIADIASGVVLLALRPLDVGDAVDVGGTLGVVECIDLFSTRIVSFDGVPTTLSNSAVRGSKISNFSRAKRRRIDLEIGIGYGDDIGKARGAIQEVLDAEKRLLKDPGTLINVTALGDSAVILLVRGWTAASDFFDTKLDLTRAIKEKLDASGVQIPFPQRDVHLIKSDASA